MLLYDLNCFHSHAFLSSLSRMGGEVFPSPGYFLDDLPAPVPESSTGCRSSGSPIRVLVLLHKAVRKELEELRRVATNAAEIEAHGRKLTVVELRRRFEFLRSVYVYHCAAEDEVIFQALDGRMENIACTYSLEHNSIDCTFESIFSSLNGLSEDKGNASQEFQELIFRIGTLHESICQHMFKEEKQVFPLFMKQFSDEEQAALVWQYMCSVPVILMEELFPWLACFLSPDEQLDMKHCVKRIMPQDKSLQEVVISWLEKTTREPPDPGGLVQYATTSYCADKPDNLKDLCKFYLPKSSSGCQREQDLQIHIKGSPVSGLLLWHAAIRSELKEILDKLYQIRSKKISNMTSVIPRINFLTDVLIFYSNALERVFYPMLEDSSVLQLSPSYQSFPHKNEVEVLQQILYDANQNKLANPRFVEMLCSKVEALMLATCKHMSFQETEVFSLICKKCNHESQQKSLVRSLRMLPLGLLKCVAIWFSSRLPKNELRPILHILDRPGFLDKSFASLLHEWIRTGYSGKSTTQDLQEMFNSRVSYMSEQIGEGKKPFKKSKHAMIGHCSVDSSRSFLSNSLSKQFQPTKKHGTLYSSGKKSPIFYSRESNLVHSLPGCPTEAVSFNCPEARPIDHIYCFHKAIKKDLDSLVLNTTKLSENMGLLMEFNQHFHLVRSLYELHSETEDEIAFPALEAKQEARNLTQSYSIDHKLEAECFDRVSRVLDEMSELSHTVSSALVDPMDPAFMKYRQLCFKLQDSCISLKKILNDHIHREEMELWPLFREYFTIEEQEKIIGYMLGRTRAEILQEMIVWLMASLTSEEQHAMMTFWRKATRYTMFDEWLGEWWEGMNRDGFTEAEETNISPSSPTDSLEVISKYLSKSTVHDRGEDVNDKYLNGSYDDSKATTMIETMEGPDVDNQKHKSSEYMRLFSEKEERHQREEKLVDLVKDSSHILQLSHIVRHENKLLVMSQVELETAIRTVSQDPSLDLQEKSRVIQNLMTSHWVAAHPPLDNVITSEPGKLPGQCPSYRDIGGSVFGCKHYKQNCKLVAACCNKLFTCRRCHDEVADHLMDRKATTHMMCMKCLEIQPIGSTCSTPSCNNYTMARYYCKICRLFDDDREIYHCPYCNICRVGKGLGIDYFHCMKCNACMSRSLSVHMCREKCFEDKCPICHEDIFTSSIPIKALACGHLMHSTCFQDYTLMHYTCPVCSKSLGNMQVYFEMLDALLAEEKMPDEFVGQTQAILCNDCEKKGTAPFHWLYHKCPFCGSYNTRLL